MVHSQHSRRGQLHAAFLNRQLAVLDALTSRFTECEQLVAVVVHDSAYYKYRGAL